MCWNPCQLHISRLALSNGVRTSRAQRPFRCVCLERVPAVDGPSSPEQGLEFRVRAAPAADLANLVEIVRQAFACKVERKRLAEAERPFVGDRDVFLVVGDVFGQLIVEFGQVGKFGVMVDFAGLSADIGVVFPAAVHVDKHERLEDVVEADRHGLGPTDLPVGADLFALSEVVSSPVCENIIFPFFEKIMRMIRLSRLGKSGERVVTIVARDAMDVMTPRDERRSLHAAKACGPGAPGLALSLARRSARRR
jgi:hypothetical protein